MSGRRLTEAEVSEIVRLYQGGSTISEICRRPNAPVEKTVRHHLQRLGIDLRGRTPHVDKDEILRLLAKGIKPAEVAHQVGCHASYVRKVARENNHRKTSA